MVFESVLVQVLNRFLGAYVENLDPSQLKANVWSGMSPCMQQRLTRGHVSSCVLVCCVGRLLPSITLYSIGRQREVRRVEAEAKCIGKQRCLHLRRLTLLFEQDKLNLPFRVCAGYLSKLCRTVLTSLRAC